MSRIGIKICGLSTPETLDAALGAGATHVGFVHFDKSPRHLNVANILAQIRRVRDHVRTVVLLVDPTPDLIGAFWVGDRPDIIQLHGNEPANFIGQIRQQYPFEYWKAIGVASSRDLFRSRSYVGAVERVLFDAKQPVGSDLPGGNGTRIDWELLRGYREQSLPWGLAGGLDPANVAEAIRITRAPLVDVSSGVESAPGIKDVDKIAAFCKAALS